MTGAESMTWDVWGPPVVVLLLGVVVGLVLALRARGGATASGRGEREALQARKEMLMEQLRAMEADRDKLEAGEFAQRRDALVGEAALVLQALDELESPAAVDGGPADEAPADGAAPATPARRKVGVRVAWGVGVVAFFVVLGVGLAQFSKPRPQGGTMTGGSAGAEGPAAVSPEVQAALAVLEDEPTNLDALNIVSYDALLKGQLDAAMGYIDTARGLAPKDPDVLVHVAMLHLAINMNDRAVSGFEAAIAARPDWGRPRMWLGLAHLNLGDNALAKQSFEAALERDLRADEARFCQQLLAQAQRPAQAGGPAAGGGGAPAAASTAPPAAADQRLSGRLTLDPAVQAQPGQTVFVIVHRNAAGKGPPVAAKRLTAESLPTDFWFTDSDQMMGGEWPDEVYLFARLDADGVAGSGEGDVESPRLGPLAKGATDVALVIGGSP